MTKEEMLNILNLNKDLIEDKDFQNFYKRVICDDRRYFTDLFLKSNIDPLLYMNTIPFYYAVKLDSLTSVRIPNNIEVIDVWAFLECNNLDTIIFDKNSKLNKIDSGAFKFCSSLKSIEIPKDVTYIGSQAFYRCDDLRNITFDADSKLQNIGQYAFFGCGNLVSISIPKYVKSIEACAFQGCTNLKSITLSKNIEEIRYNAFNICTSLSDVYYEGSQEDWDKIDFHGDHEIFKNATIHYSYKI